jgi:hypothetical protein
LQLGSPKLWNQVMAEAGIQSFAELALALKTSISALKKEYARSDLAALLNRSISNELFYPREDNISEFFISDILDVLGSDGASTLIYSDPIFDHSGELKINELTELIVSELAPQEIVLTNEKLNYAFLSVYDSFITMFLSKENKIEEIISQKKWRQ